MGTIKMEGRTERFYQGVAAGSRVRDEHATVEFGGDREAQFALFWFYVGALAAGECGLSTSEEFAHFLEGARLRAPDLKPDEDDDEEDAEE